MCSIPWCTLTVLSIVHAIIKCPNVCFVAECFRYFIYLFVWQLPPCSKTFQEAQSDLNQTAADLNQSAGDVVHASRGTTIQLSDASGKFSEDFDEFLDAGIEMAGHTQVWYVKHEHDNVDTFYFSWNNKSYLVV